MENWFKHLCKWLEKLLGNKELPGAAIKPDDSFDDCNSPQPPGQQEPAADPVRRLEPDATDFLLALLAEIPPADLQQLSFYDRTFIATLLKKLRTDTFEIPLLPEAALQIQRLLSSHRVNASDFVDMFKSDPALSAELIKLANSVYYGATIPVHDLQLAVTRVGFNQIQGLVIMMSLRTRILRGKGLHREVGWVTELSLMMAMACQQLASDLSMSPGEAFTLGLLHHVEYFVLLGAASEYISSHQGTKISAEALMEAMRRLGAPVHDLTVRNWGLEGLELPELVPFDEEEEPTDENTQLNISSRLDMLQRILIEKWSGGSPDTAIPGFDTDAVSRMMAAVLPTSAGNQAV
ncbi:MAG: HDOD domain-containing protein [Deltaproteobacteria bacterium]|nr:HDOD domain-containing protein [Deltaproteobacteria bacterium]